MGAPLACGITPHSSSSTDTTAVRRWSVIAGNLDRFARGEPTVVGDRGIAGPGAAIRCEAPVETGRGDRDAASRRGCNASDSFLCPAGQRLHPYSSSLMRGLKKINYRNSQACRDCAIRSQCTGNQFRSVSRLENEAVLDRMQARIGSRRVQLTAQTA
jgi:hypothetical protein